MNRGKLHELVHEVSRLIDMGCHMEARIKVAVAFDFWCTARVLMHLDAIHSLKRELPSDLERRAEAETQEVLRHVGNLHGPEVKAKLSKALSRKGKES